MREVSRRGLIALSGAGGLGLVAGCGDPAGRRTPSGEPGRPATKAPATPSARDMSVPGPKDLTASLLASDVLVFSKKSLSNAAVEKIRAIEFQGAKAVLAVEPMAMGQFFVDDQPVTYAAVDPRTFWRYTVPGTAQTASVWKRVAGGEMAVQEKIGKALQTGDGYLKLGNDVDAPTAHIGAYAQLLNPLWARQIDAVVNDKWIGPLGMEPRNAAIVSTGPAPQKIFKQLQAAAGPGASVQILGPNLDLSVAQTAVLTGGSVAKAVGSFNYTANADGTVNPDPAWVRGFIRTETMPIIGRVTGNRVMLPQLRGALDRVVAAGRSSSIYTYDGCYVPRFIARDPSRGLSFHTFGTAIDLNARDNYRGIAGKMDRVVVQIFKDWGFDWGGDWNYTDPMHFELARLAKAT